MIFDKKWRMYRKATKAINHCRLTDRGIYLAHYLINKYINLDVEDDITAYETEIERLFTSSEFEKIYKIFFPISLETEEEENDRKRHFAAVKLLTIILLTLIPEQRETLFNQVNETNREDFIKFYYTINKQLLKGE